MQNLRIEDAGLTEIFGPKPHGWREAAAGTAGGAILAPVSHGLAEAVPAEGPAAVINIRPRRSKTGTDFTKSHKAAPRKGPAPTPISNSKLCDGVDTLVHDLAQPLAAIANYLNLALHLIDDADLASLSQGPRTREAIVLAVAEVYRANAIGSQIKSFLRDTCEGETSTIR